MKTELGRTKKQKMNPQCCLFVTATQSVSCLYGRGEWQSPLKFSSQPRQCRRWMESLRQAPPPSAMIMPTQVLVLSVSIQGPIRNDDCPEDWNFLSSHGHFRAGIGPRTLRIKHQIASRHPPSLLPTLASLSEDFHHHAKQLSYIWSDQQTEHISKNFKPP